MMKTALLSMVAVSAVSAVELTPETYDEMTAGKTVFLKFFAPWCGHCKKMKPAWDNLMAEFADNTATLVADVDCTTAGKPLCDANGVKGFPTLKYGDPSALEDYSGGREAADLKKFAEGLKPTCSVANLDLCDEEGKAAIQVLLDQTDEELAAIVAKGEATIKEAESTFEKELQILQDSYKKLQDDKEAAIAAAKATDFGKAKAVLAHKKKGTAAKEEL